MLKLILIVVGLVLLASALFFLIKAIRHILGLPFEILERHRNKSRLQLHEASEKQYLAEEEQHQSFCLDVRSLERNELVQLWEKLSDVPVWYAINTTNHQVADAKLVTEFDGKRLFLCRAGDVFHVVHSEPSQTYRVQFADGENVPCYQGTRNSGYGWSILRSEPEKYLRHVSEIELKEHEKDEREKRERLKRLGLSAPQD